MTNIRGDCTSNLSFSTVGISVQTDMLSYVPSYIETEQNACKKKLSLTSHLLQPLSCFSASHPLAK